MAEPIVVAGCDLSINHGAVVELTDGEISNFWYYTELAGSASQSKRGFRVPPEYVNQNSKVPDRQIRAMLRLAWFEHFFDKKVLMKSKAKYWAIEDYALDVGHGAHQMGEVGGIARILCWFRGVNIRLHDPVSLKMFAAHNGTVDKNLMEERCSERWGMDFSHLNQPLPAPTKRTPEPKQNRQTSQDLADALALAKLVDLEVRLRLGLAKLQDLHEKEVRVFNRITKAYPISLLDRDWIVNPDGVPTPHGEPVCDTCGSRKCCLAGKHES